jgi:hypothetical protein
MEYYLIEVRFESLSGIGMEECAFGGNWFYQRGDKSDFSNEASSHNWVAYESTSITCKKLEARSSNHQKIDTG